MDSSHISLCELNLKATGFTDYRCDRDLSMGLSLTNLAKILKCAGNDDTVAIRSADDSDVATFVFESTKTDKISEFEFKLMDIDSESLNVPDKKYDCQVKMPSKEFRTIITDLAALGDNCTISVSKEGVSFSVSGDMGTANVSVRQKSAADEKAKDGTVIDLQNPVKLTFTIRHLLNFTKATPLSERVHLSMSADHPLVVEYVMEGAGDIKYYLAPKLDDEAA
jgi:proliferating cell nuclear antigen